MGRVKARRVNNPVPVKARFDRFPPEQIRVYLYEDWDQKPQAVLHDVFVFLGIDNNIMIEPKRANITFNHRHLWLHRFLDQPNLPRKLAEKVLRGCLYRGLYRRLRVYNQFKPPAIELALRQELTESYRSDIEQLQALIGRDLSHWIYS